MLSKILETSTKTSVCVKRLELGVLPISYIIKKKRVLYFQKLLKSDEKNLAKKVLLIQLKQPKRGDFAQYVKKDLEEIGMRDLTLNDFEKYSLKEFKNLVSKRIKQSALEHLIAEKSKQKKGTLLKYNTLEMQNYFKSSSEIKSSEAKNIFNLRSNTLDVADNFSKKYSRNSCVIDEQCKGTDSQKHYFECPFISINFLSSQSDQTKYEDIYGNEVRKQAFVTRIVMNTYKQRNKIMSSFDHHRNDPAEP